VVWTWFAAPHFLCFSYCAATKSQLITLKKAAT
jgi:hypothetical protein